MNKNINYKRILLKLSGESLLGQQPFGIDSSACQKIASIVTGMHAEGLQVAIVIGGGNIFRGVSLKDLGMARTPADHIGMLATIMNGIALQQALESAGCKTYVMSALECPKVAHAYNWEASIEALSTGHTLIFVGGTGNPYFTTDTAAALRASEIQADLLLKATKVDGVYDKDPLKNSHAKKFEEIASSDFLAQKLGVMDAAAVALCMNNKIPIYVFNMNLLDQMKISNIVQEKKGTLIY